MKETIERRSSYRCKVASELSDATIECNRKKTKAILLETSLGGFTIAIPLDLINDFPGGELAILRHQEEVWLVQISRCYREGDDTLHLGLRRVADGTPMKFQSDSRGKQIPAYSVVSPIYNSMIPTCFVVGTITLAIALPGVFDLLGSSKSIQTSIKSLSKFFKRTLVPVASSPHVPVASSPHVPVASSPNAPFETVMQAGATDNDSRSSSDPTSSAREEQSEPKLPTLPGFVAKTPQPTQSKLEEAEVPGTNTEGAPANRPKKSDKDDTNR